MQKTLQSLAWSLVTYLFHCDSGFLLFGVVDVHGIIARILSLHFTFAFFFEFFLAFILKVDAAVLGHLVFLGELCSVLDAGHLSIAVGGRGSLRGATLAVLLGRGLAFALNCFLLLEFFGSVLFFVTLKICFGLFRREFLRC